MLTAELNERPQKRGKKEARCTSKTSGELERARRTRFGLEKAAVDSAESLRSARGAGEQTRSEYPDGAPGELRGKSSSEESKSIARPKPDGHEDEVVVGASLVNAKLL